MTTIESKIANRLQPLMARASTVKQWAEINELEAVMRADELMKMERNQWTQHSPSSLRSTSRPLSPLVISSSIS